MATAGNSNNSQQELSDIKRKLVWRMVFAGFMILALLVALWIADRLMVEDDIARNLPTYNEPVPVPKKEATQPVKEADPAPALAPAPEEVKKDEKKDEKPVAAMPEATAPPVDKSAPVLEPPPRPEVQARPVLPPASKPIQHTPSTSASKPLTGTRPVESAAKPAEAAPMRPQPAPPAQAVQATPPAPPRLLSSGYALQAGVFSEVRRAEELHAKLTLEGIPSTIESRVQVGPFRNKQEAEAARVKLKALGIDAVMLPPKGAK